MDDLIKYISLISVAGAGISFVVGLWKYLDQRNREDRTKRFELFHDLMGRVSAHGEGGTVGLPLSQQVAAVYELQHFPEYSYASVPILEHLKEYFEKKGVAQVLLTAIDATLAALRK